MRNMAPCIIMSKGWYGDIGGHSVHKVLFYVLYSERVIMCMQKHCFKHGLVNLVKWKNLEMCYGKNGFKI